MREIIAASVLLVGLSIPSTSHALVVYDPTNFGAKQVEIAKVVVEIQKAIQTIKTLNKQAQRFLYENDLIYSIQNAERLWGDVLVIQKEIKSLPNDLKGGWKQALKQYYEFSPRYDGWTSVDPMRYVEYQKHQKEREERLLETLKAQEAEAKLNGPESEEVIRNRAKLMEKTEQRIKRADNMTKNLQVMARMQHDSLQEMQKFGDAINSAHRLRRRQVEIESAERQMNKAMNSHANTVREQDRINAAKAVEESKNKPGHRIGWK